MKKLMILGGLTIMLAGGSLQGAMVSRACGEKQNVIVDTVDNLQLARSLEDGIVTGDGVRLRKDASANATVLEAMEKNERVIVNTSKTKGKWRYVKRVKTGTWGWMNTDYLRIL